MTMDCDRRHSLSAADAQDVIALAHKAERTDGVFPLNEQAVLALSQQENEDQYHLIIRRSGNLTAYAWWKDASAQIVVDPAYRRQGLGSILLDCVTQIDPDTELWSFGDCDAARGFCAKHRYEQVRALLILEAHAPFPIKAASTQFTITTFRDDDLDDLVALHSKAFSHHPEQASWTKDDFRRRFDSDWFDPHGLFIAWHSQTMVGFLWTKQLNDTGEIYILGVDPAREGAGLGRQLLEHSLKYFQQRGINSVRLWVDQAETRAQILYQSSGFSLVRKDLRYRYVDKIEELG
ncbi:MAG: mycothiol synthase [Propionibacteriaceae bacterium]|nr:mycothiol synthase [Propionibacteriaceae bacterium]